MRNTAYRLYRYKIFPRIQQVRGSTAVKLKLEKLTEHGLEHADNGRPVTDLEWDHLIILDACRADLYRETVDRGTTRITVGSHSQEFVEHTFSTGDFSDTVVVTANPHYHASKFNDLTGRDVDDVFAKVYHTYLADDPRIDETGAIPADLIVEDVRKAVEDFPGKRLIIHFMQPHAPFIGADMSIEGAGVLKDTDVWQLAEQNRLGLSDDELWSAYRANLEYVMRYVRELRKMLSGDVAVTADHGNLVGENGRYGHPHRSSARVVREVPWDVWSEDENPV